MSAVTLKPAPVSRCTAAQEMAEALKVLQQIATRLDAQKEKPVGEGNEGV